MFKKNLIKKMSKNKDEKILTAATAAAVVVVVVVVACLEREEVMHNSSAIKIFVASLNIFITFHFHELLKCMVVVW